MEPVLVEVTRSGMVESRHRGSVVALAADGSVALALGDVDSPVYGRSANKPLQAAAMVELGLDVPPELLALVCASHNGEPAHIEAVRRILAGAGLDESALRNTPSLPLYEPAAADVLARAADKERILQNCSGKHAGMVATCVINGWPVDGYEEPDHPLQETITGVIASLTGEAAGAHRGRRLRRRPRTPYPSPPWPAALPHVAGSAVRDRARQGAGRDDRAPRHGRRHRARCHRADGDGPRSHGQGRRRGGTGGRAPGRARRRPQAGRRVMARFAAVLLAALDQLGVDTSGAETLRSSRVLGGGHAVGEARAALA